MLCLPKHIANKFIEKLKDGTITPEKLMGFKSSEERRNFLKDIVGEENAQWVNAEFESKLILKNQQRGIITWAKKVGNLSPKAQRDILSRVEKMDKILTPETEGDFLQDLAEHKLGTAITAEEAANLYSLSNEATKSRKSLDPERKRGLFDKASDDEMKYGLALKKFTDYLDGIKQEAKKKTLPQAIQDYLDNPVSFVNDLFGSFKSIRGSLDLSFIMRQGIKPMLKGLTGDVTSARIWKDSFRKNIEIAVKTLGGDKTLDILYAEIVSDPDYPLIKKAKVATATPEEAYPSNWPEKIPIIGTAFKVGEHAYIGTAHYMRYKLAKMYLNQWRNSGIELTDKELSTIGRLVNSLTARGDTGVRQEPGLVNNLLWSPRNLKSDLDVLTMHLFDKNFSKKGRIEAAKNLIRIAAGTAMILGTAQLFKDESVTWDSNSSDFGKIKIGETRFSVGGALPAMVVLASRLIHRARTNANGETVKYNTGKYGEPTMKDAVYNFFENRFSPSATFIKDWLDGKDYNYNDFNAQKELVEMSTPMILSNYLESANAEDSANIVLIMLAEVFGVNTNTYTNK